MTIDRDPVQAQILAKEITDLLKKKAIVQISTSKQLIGFYSTYFLVPEKDSGLKILTTAQILESIELGEWFTSVDLKDAYFHIPICQDHSPFLHFAFQDRVYQFRVLPFGLTLSPRVFTGMFSAALHPLHCAALKIRSYLDNWIICAPSRSEVMKDTEMVLQHVQSLGLKVNWEKSNLSPRQ